MVTGGPCGYFIVCHLAFSNIVQVLARCGEGCHFVHAITYFYTIYSPERALRSSLDLFGVVASIGSRLAGGY